MLNSPLKTLSKNVCTLLRSYTTAHPGKWDLLSAVCLERRPVIIPELNEIEKAFQQQLTEIEFERSYKSNHEIQHEEDLKQAELLKKGEGDIDVSTKQTAQDFIDAGLDELNNFQFASRITDADKKGDVKSLQRKLDKHLVLLVRQKFGEKSFFLLPQGLREEGETLRQTAERVLLETCGADVKSQIYGNAPFGFYKYKYPIEIRQKNGVVGAKVFIYFARYLSGQIPSKQAEYKWLDRLELKEELPPAYHSNVVQFLIDEN